MNMTRRQLMAVGSAGGAIALLAGSPLAAAAAPETSISSLTLISAKPRVVSDPVLDTQILARARDAFARHGRLLTHTDKIGIADFARASRDLRFFILDIETGDVSAHLVAHGRGSDPDHCGWLRRFSNEPGSLATSQGAYLTSNVYDGHYGPSMRLKGLDSSNSNAEERAIVVHSAWYAEPNIVEQQGKLGRSEGCFAFSRTSHQTVMAELGPGRLIYADWAES